MNTPMKPTSNRYSTAPNYFIVAGISLKSIRKELKPALPKKRQESSYLVVITTTSTSVKFAIAGAAIELPATTSGPFIAELPYIQFKFILTEPFEPGAQVRFELMPGSFSVNGMATKSQHILVRSGGRVAAARQSASSVPAPVIANRLDTCPAAPAIANPLDTTLGLPLLVAYVHLRKYGLQPRAASKTFARQQLQVDGLLDRVDRLLRPVGITRADLERLLDRKVGLV